LEPGGCTKISPGCKYCYAEVLAKRLQRMGANGYENGFKLTLLPERLDAPLKRRKPTVWFVNSMSDLFHEGVPFAFIDRVFETIAATPHHRYQILTKRPDRMETYFKGRSAPSNAWLGTSVENRKYGVPRIAIDCALSVDRAAPRRRRYSRFDGHLMGQCRRRVRDSLVQ
jgi:protein gp37